MDVYHLSGFEYRVISFATALPGFLVWFAAFIGYAKLLDYARSIRKTPEGVYFKQLAIGCAWLAWSLPVTKTLSSVLSGMVEVWPGFHDASIIIGNYVGLILPLIAFSIIGVASRGLINDAKLRLSQTSMRAIMLLFIVAGVSFCYFTFKHLGHDGLGSTDNPYYLPTWLLVLTLIIPYLYAWFVGILSAWELALFGRNIGGHLYRKAVLYLVSGLGIVIFSSIAIQYIGSVQPRVGYLLLNSKLFLTLLFRILQGVGFGLMAVGAVRLKKIEEV